MTLQEFMYRFQLSPQPKNADRFCIPEIIASNKTFRESAVLIPVIEINNKIQILLNQRAAHLTHHAGQICFPGGKVTQEDNNVQETAVRETIEELGIDPKHINIIGQLPAQHTYTGFRITPIVALLNPEYTVSIDPNEVQSYFWEPLEPLQLENNRRIISTSRAGVNYQVLVLNGTHHIIWGATASIIDVLGRKLSMHSL